MEFPDLGAHCSEPSCQRLDFLPLKCDACSGIFCADHVTYAQHHCGSAYQKDIQVPVCPLCNVPVPVARGEPPDRAVGEHIDRDCRSDPAQQKRKIFTNKCERSGCRQREMMRLTCDRCGRNFCIKHRHPLDHDCSAEGHPTSQAGLAAISRAQGPASTSTVPSLSWTWPSSTSPNRATIQSSSRTAPPVIALQNGLVSWAEIGQKESQAESKVQGNCWFSFFLCRVKTRLCSGPWNYPWQRPNPRSQVLRKKKTWL
uniref:AN1-type zinc finger protein 2B isoform X2 n=1 Tax=Castor canadensis TaxID=51338 RepID=A0A8B7V3X1_CASCN|nr:AN1-type zinc finger protein 2B isoform X2 [Castor canadensis]